ncbi:hypothetical protein TNCV_3506271 [Trichonephila clavipes]|uniref:Uncharacterized protein n=1 Tax=Trichonephila clavipes TaxID=2585209 RepID=A0A8X6RVU3_TRICX|nr:hypothetical protein TNCV_3506271 [Trichonephila clavipes]
MQTTDLQFVRYLAAVSGRRISLQTFYRDWPLRPAFCRVCPSSNIQQERPVIDKLKTTVTDITIFGGVFFSVMSRDSMRV